MNRDEYFTLVMHVLNMMTVFFAACIFVHLKVVMTIFDKVIFFTLLVLAIFLAGMSLFAKKESK